MEKVSFINMESRSVILKSFLIILSILLFLNTANVFADGKEFVLVGIEGFSDSTVTDVSISVDSNGVPYVAYRDAGNIDKATVMKYDGSSWVNVGTPGFSAGAAAYTSIAIDSNDVPYVAYQDNGNGGRSTVMKYDGSSWVNVGTPGFSSVSVSDNSLKFDSNDVLYLSYSRADNAKATVMKYNGSSWEVVGTESFSAGMSSYNSLSIDSDDVLYVAYRDSSVSYKTTVKKYNGSSWVNVGTPGFSAGAASYTSLAIDSNDVLHLAYQDNGNGGRSTVMKYNGSSWVNVGTPGFSAGAASYTSLAIDSNDDLYVVYKDAGNSNKASAMKYNGSSWEVVGTPGFSAGAVAYTSIAIDPSDVPYTAYRDSTKSFRATVMKYNFPNIFSYSGSFSESSADDGSITGSILATLENDTFVNAGSILTEGIHYTITNKPEGLTSVMSISANGLIATLTFTGNATSHEVVNSVTDLTITFLDGAFTNTATASDIVGYTDNTGLITFYDLTGPVTLSLIVTPARETVSVLFTTSESATSTFSYGTTDAYGTEINIGTGTTSHSVELVGLTCGTTYHYKIVTIDNLDNWTTSTDGTFNTEACVVAQNEAQTTPLGTTVQERVRNLISIGKYVEAEQLKNQYPFLFPNILVNQSLIGPEVVAQISKIKQQLVSLVTQVIQMLTLQIQQAR